MDIPEVAIQVLQADHDPLHVDDPSD